MLNYQDIRYRIRFKWRSLISIYPRIYAGWVGLRYPLAAFGLTKWKSDLVLEGYPRSGNTFAWYAFIMAQTCPYDIAHHSHNPGRIIEAVRHQIPTLVLIRNPRDCVISYCIYEPRLTLDLALNHWIRFYNAIKPYKDGYIIATFDEVVTDFSAVISRVNDQFETKFELFDHTEENVKEVFSKIKFRTQLVNKRVTTSTEPENQISIPSEYREQKKESLKKSINKNKQLTKKWQLAKTLYKDIVSQ